MGDRFHPLRAKNKILVLDWNEKALMVIVQ